MAWNNDDYVQVNDRIAAFYERYPEGSLRSRIVEMTDERVIVKAWAYRHPEDKHPATGHSYLAIPGSTNFTKGSELENAETSAWGRALAALGFEVKRSVASREEVASKRSQPAKKPSQGNESRIADFFTWCEDEYGMNERVVMDLLGVKGKADITDLKAAVEHVKEYAGAPAV